MTSQSQPPAWSMVQGRCVCVNIYVWWPRRNTFGAFQVVWMTQVSHYLAIVDFVARAGFLQLTAILWLTLSWCCHPFIRHHHCHPCQSQHFLPLFPWLTSSHSFKTNAQLAVPRTSMACLCSTNSLPSPVLTLIHWLEHSATWFCVLQVSFASWPSLDVFRCSWHRFQPSSRCLCFIHNVWHVC